MTAGLSWNKRSHEYSDAKQKHLEFNCGIYILQSIFLDRL